MLGETGAKRVAQALGQTLAGLGHFFAMIYSREARTQHGQRLITLMEGGSFNAIVAAFEGHSDGRALLQALPDTDSVLADHADLAQRPVGSFGRSYLDFMISNGFGPAAYAETAKRAAIGFSPDPKRTWLRNRVDTLHDVRHVIAGYGADLLGEACVLAFRTGQLRHPGAVVLAGVAAIGCIFLNGPIATIRALAEARRRGRSALLVDLCPFEFDLSEPLESYRARLGLTPPQVYQTLAGNTLRWRLFKRRRTAPLRQAPSA